MPHELTTDTHLV